MAQAIKSPEVIISFPHILEATAGPGQNQKPKFSGSFVVTPEQQKKPEFSALVAEAKAAAKEKWGDKGLAMVTVGGKGSTFRNDGASKGYPEGSLYINARSEQKPGVVSLFPDPITKKAKLLTDEEIKEQIYAGAIVRVMLRAFAYDNSGNKGVAFALGNIQKIRDGERLDGRKPADEEFDADLAAAPEALNDLLK